LLRHLDRLEKAGLIERRVHPTDRRVQQLYLTPRSQQLLDRITAMTAEVQDQIMHGLSKAERAQLLTSLERIKSNLTQLTGPALGVAATPAKSKPRR
jgi:DNA-binding MarR family transcriptional regulator